MIKTDLHWRASLPCDISPHLREWLCYSGSFMQRLADKGAENPAIRVLHQAWQCPLPWEKKWVMSDDHASPAWIREVLIFSGTHYWMLARTVIPQETLMGKYESLMQLGEKALGTILFQDPDMKRSPFEFASVPSHSLIEDYDASYMKSDHNECWGRRSLFSLQKKTLLLTELLLPDIMLL